MSVMFPICKAPGPHSCLSEEFLHSTILRPKNPLVSWNLVSPLLRINKAWTDKCAARLQPMADQYKTPTKPNFRNRKIPRFVHNNPIMSWGQKHLLKIVSLISTCRFKGSRKNVYDWFPFCFLSYWFGPHPRNYKDCCQLNIFNILDVPVSIECMVGEESPASLDVFDSVIGNISIYFFPAILTNNTICRN